MSETTALRALERTNVKPILFSGPMIRALVDGRKTQTRRVLKPQPIERPGLNCRRLDWFDKSGRHRGNDSPDGDMPWIFTPYAPGDLLWVRETWVASGTGVWTIADARRQIATDQKLHFAADGGDGPWWPSIHMPREFSRLTLEVTAVKVERLQEISEEDADAEVFGGDFPHNVLPELFPDADNSGAMSLPECFALLWDSLNAKRGYGWEENPWVVAVSFRVHKMNVDTILAQREAA